MKDYEGGDGIEGSIERFEDIIEEGFQILQDFSIDELLQKIYNDDKYILLELLDMLQDSINTIISLTEKK
jgi:hypothetical protein